MKTVTIEGPCGPFLLPAEPEITRNVCEAICKEVWAGEYDHPELPTLGNGGTILDVGAGWGAFAVWAHKRWPNAEVWSYEPHAAAFALLLENCRHKELHGNRYEVAVTAIAHPRLALFENWCSNSTYSDVNPTTRLLGYADVEGLHPRMLPPASILKIDAEGVEIEILANYQHWDVLKAVLYEYHSKEHKIALFDICLDRGMRLLHESAQEAYGVALWVK